MTLRERVYRIVLAFLWDELGGSAERTTVQDYALDLSGLIDEMLEEHWTTVKELVAEKFDMDEELQSV